MSLPTHIVQSQEWGNIKTSLGTPAVRVADTQYTKHKIPFTPFYYAYCPKIDPFKINFEKVKQSLKQNNCVAINFDVPNVVKESEDAARATQILKNHCVPTAKTTFATRNVLMNITPETEEIMEKMHKKHRYNARYAQRKGVKIEINGQTAFKDFFKMLKETAERQKYYIHPKSYYKKIWETLKPLGKCHIITGKYKGETLAAWMFFNHKGVLYYPYGGSSEQHQNLQASTLVAWEGIKLGKRLDCKIFDMWGACEDINNQQDPWWGFTNFKLRFGGKYVEYIDSYDMVVNPTVYKLFNLVNKLRWKVLKLLK